MRSFAQWLEEKKKKEKEPAQTTPTSAPLRGQNQDQSGVGVKNSNADYTISDETIVELSPELVGKVNKARTFGKPSKTKAASQALSGAVRRAWLKSNVGKIKEATSTSDTAVRNTPVSMSSTSHTSSADAPKSSGALQSSANSRRVQLDKAAQKQREAQQKQRETETKNRQKEAEQRAKQSASKAPKPPQQAAESYVMNVVKKLASHVGKNFLDGAVGKTTSNALTSTKLKPKGKK
jgi:hypothetical protein